MIKPISPAEAKKSGRGGIPDEVFQVFNEYLEMGGGRTVIIAQDEIATVISNRYSRLTRELLFRNKWLDVEAAYRAAGWDVEYDKPGFNETYEAHWTFKPKRGRR